MRFKSERFNSGQFFRVSFFNVDTVFFILNYGMTQISKKIKVDVPTSFTSNQGVIKDNRGIKELFDILNDPRFIFVDRSYFVNLDYAKELCGNSIIMLNGEALPVSRPMMPKVKEAILSLWGDGLVK